VDRRPQKFHSHWGYNNGPEGVDGLADNALPIELAGPLKGI